MPRRRYLRRKKTTPLKELGFVISLCIIAIGLAAYREIRLDFKTIAMPLALTFALLCIIYIFLLLKQRRKKIALQALELSNVDEMTGVEFEEYASALLRSQGYKTHTTPRSGDYGVGLIASKNGVKTAIQIKRYKGKVNQDAVRQAIAGMAMKQYNCTKSMVMTNSTFTKLARDLAQANNCDLIDREKLGEWIVKFKAIRK